MIASIVLQDSAPIAPPCKKTFSTETGSISPDGLILRIPAHELAMDIDVAVSPWKSDVRNIESTIGRQAQILANKCFEIMLSFMITQQSKGMQ